MTAAAWAPVERRVGWTRAAEFLAVGGLTPFVFAASYALRRWLGLDAAEYGVGFVFFYAAYAINDPHFTVTYLLFYRGAREKAFGAGVPSAHRARYLLAGVVVPLALLAWATTALSSNSPRALAGIIQTMFFLVGWHYVKQGFGVMNVLAVRRGVRLLRHERFAFLAHCYAGWAYAWANPPDPGTLVEEKGVVYTTLAHGPALDRVTRAAFVATILPVAWVLVRRRHELRALMTPALALLVSVWSWTVYSSIDPLVRYVTPALHSVQYLYVVWLARSAEARDREGPPLFDRPVAVKVGVLFAAAVALGILAFHAGPSAFDGLLVRPAGVHPLGPTPYFAAIYACVNIHHYFMDFALWRRGSPEMTYLGRPPLAHALDGGAASGDA